MTMRSSTLGAFAALLAFATSLTYATAIDAPTAPVPAGATIVLRGPQPVEFGGGPMEGPKDLITDEQREEIRKQIDASVERLRVEGRLAATAPGVAHPLFAWPLRLAAGLPDPGYHGISNFVDLDPNYPGFLLDYNCGTRSYDTNTGYNHQGTDFFTWPWGWRKMDRKEVEIVAAAPGQIIYKSDGNSDRSCSFNNNNWNAVYVQHADGSYAYYGHMKNGSQTTKPAGEMVAEGEFLGVVGSSGNSTGPHLHFENHDGNGFLIEPWFGPCNNLNAESWWQSQRPYYDSAVERVTTGAAAAVFPACGTDETPNAQSAFVLGSTIYFTTYYRDQLASQTSLYTIYRPDGSIYAQWNHSSPAPHYAASWWYWSLIFPAGEMQGTWRFTVDYESGTYERLFTIGADLACGSVGDNGPGDILLLQKISTSVRLNWGVSCNPTDTDYVVYQGTIGNFASHAKVFCSTSGNRTAILSPPAGGYYFLVGARNAAHEGSLGLTSSGAERPVGTVSCLTRSAFQCP